MRNKGITLVTLIITIIVLLILGGVAISMITAGDGLIGKSNTAGEMYNNSALNEAERLNALVNEEYLIEYPDGSWDEEGKVNSPQIKGTGLIPVIINEDGTHKELTPKEAKSTDWYNYADTTLVEQENKSQWANAVTKNDKGEVTGYFVWIPRYEYKIEYTNPADKSKGGTIDVNFVPTEETTATDEYIIHPAFTDESSTGTGIYQNFENGGWDSEIPGFWVAKFQAGFAGGNNTATPVDSRITHTGTTASTNYYGKVTSGSTAIKYPVFLPKTYAYNYINIGDMYNISREIEKASYYGLTNVDSHMMKNSEWGAVAYLMHSKYGRNRKEVTINNVNMNNKVATITGITGYAGASVSASTNDLTSTTLGDEATGSSGKSHAWNTTQGVLGSSTGNVHGVYDLTGCLWNSTSGYVPIQNTKNNITKFGGTFSKTEDNKIKTESTKYVSVYAYSGNGADRKANYIKSPNQNRIGEAIWETSTTGNNESSWHTDYPYFVNADYPYTIRTGHLGGKGLAGVFAYSCTYGMPLDSNGFRVVIIGKDKIK